MSTTDPQPQENYMEDEAQNLGNAVVDQKTEQDVMRALDAEVAERVMGWQRQPDYNYWMTFPKGGTFKLHALIATWKPSEDMRATMEVVEKMRADGWRISIMNDFGEKGPLEWSVDFANPRSGTVNQLAAELPEAICRAALKATECLSINNRRDDGQASEPK